MPAESLQKIYDGTVYRIEKFTNLKYWRLKALLILALLSCFFASGQFRDFGNTFKNIDGWKAFEQKKENIFSQPAFDENSNAAKKVFRLTVPLIAKIFHLNDYGVLLLGYLFNLLFLYFAILLTEKITGDKTTALLLTIALTFIYNGHSGFTDNNAWFDSYAYFFLLMAMFCSNAFLVFLFCELACWTDERAVVACAFVFLFWQLKENKTVTPENKQFSTNQNSLVVIIALLVFFALRYLMSSIYHLHLPLNNVGLKTLLAATDSMGLGVWSALEGFWILIVVAFVVLLKEKRFIILSFLAMLILVIMGIAFSVYDITKSAAYLFPIIFIAVTVLADKFSKQDLRKVLMACAIVCFLFPSFYIAFSDHHVEWYKPVFVRAIDYLKN